MDDINIYIKTKIFNMYSDLLHNQNEDNGYFIYSIPREPGINSFIRKPTVESRLWEKININLYIPIMLVIKNSIEKPSTDSHKLNLII